MRPRSARPHLRTSPAATWPRFRRHNLVTLSGLQAGRVPSSQRWPARQPPARPFRSRWSIAKGKRTCPPVRHTLLVVGSGTSAFRLRARWHLTNAAPAQGSLGSRALLGGRTVTHTLPSGPASRVTDCEGDALPSAASIRPLPALGHEAPMSYYIADVLTAQLGKPRSLNW